MSVSYWMIEGIGLIANDIAHRIDRAKAAKFLHEQFPERQDADEVCRSKDFGADAICDYGGFDNFADVLCHCDETDTLTYGDDGEGVCYFYYPPSMPWHRVANEPDSEEEVVKRIIRAVQKITDMSRSEIREQINFDLYAVGCG